MSAYFLKRNLRTIVLYAIFVVSWLVVGVFVKGYGTMDHLIYVIMVASFLGLVSAGQTLVIIIGSIDLSVGSVITLSGVMMTQLLSKYGLSFPLVILIIAMMCALVGIFNGMGVSLLKIPPLVMTLASTSIVQGLALIITNGTPGAITYQPFLSFANDPIIFGLNGIILTWIAAAALMTLLLSKTTFGRKLYYIGLNETASKYSGYNTNRIVISVYILAALLSGITGIFLVGFTGQSFLTMGNQYQLMSVAAVVVGGASILGGSGNYIGTIVGVLLLTLITSVLTLFRIPAGGQTAAQGAIILLLVVLNSGRRERK